MTAMTNEMKTVQAPRLILLDCEYAEAAAEIIDSVLRACTYRTSREISSHPADYVISTRKSVSTLPEHLFFDVVLFDENSTITNAEIERFRKKVTSYENELNRFGEEMDGFVTYSEKNYGADVTVRNLSERGGTLSFDLVGGGILSRLNGVRGFSAETVIASAAVLLEAGLPLAAVMNYFDHGEEIG